jgi:penicillin-binding protein 1C
VPDIPVRLGGFAPQNYTRSFQGAVPAATALARSLNVPAVHMLQSYGVERFYGLLKRLGMSTLHRSADGYGLTLILGGAEATLWDLCGIYAGLAATLTAHASGTAWAGMPPIHYLRSTSPTSGSCPFGAAAAYLCFQAMLEVERPGEESHWRNYTSSRRVAWKTGTSFGYRDAWAIGITPDYVVGVWAGNADGEGRPNLTGIEAAAPILFELLGELPPWGWFVAPETDMVPLHVCAASGLRLGVHCADSVEVRVPLQARNRTVCSYCRTVNCDSSLSWRVHADCEPLAGIRPARRFVLPPAMEWYYRRHHADYRVLPPFRQDCMDAMGESGVNAMALVYPGRGSRVFVPRDLDGSLGRAVLEAAHRRPTATIHWHLDEDYLGATSELHQMQVAPAAGMHTLTLVDEDGERLVRRFEVLARD